LPRELAIILSLIFTSLFLFLLYQEFSLRRYLRTRALTFRLAGFVAIGIPQTMRQVRILFVEPKRPELFGWDYAIAVIAFFAAWVFLICLIVGNHMIKRDLDRVAADITVPEDD
jgi:hypothetical protein